MRLVLLLSLAALSSCSATPPPPTGEEVYSQPLVDGNTFACATCHALTEPAADGIRRPGHPIGDAVRRPSFKNGRAASFLAAVNSCVTEWQAAPAWSADDPQFLALKEFLERTAPATAAPISFEIVQPPPSLEGGRVDAGRALFNSSCAVCHGTDGAGSLRGPNLAGASLAPELIARRVRTSGAVGSGTYPGLTGGRMPFWSKDRLSDAELRDLVAFVATAEIPDGGLFTPEPSSGGAPDGGAACGKTHAKIGWYTDLSTFAHGVKGRATVTDDCTITLTGFHYDGNGIDVRLYGAIDRAYASGFPIGGQLYRPGKPYVGVTLEMRLPSGKTLDQLSSVSVWCVAARQNFGDGVFRAP
jgi:mono/diheme cytochrome c family protein